ncbi:MAG: hypothetical protein ACE5H4_01680 [Candidatus Thorarchaeota archaeon]
MVESEIVRNRVVLLPPLLLLLQNGVVHVSAVTLSGNASGSMRIMESTIDIQDLPVLLSPILAINLVLLVIIIIGYLGLTWGSNESRKNTIKLRTSVLVLYSIVLVCNALIYALGMLVGSYPWEYVCPDILKNPVHFMAFLSPPVVLMYLDTRSKKWSEIIASLSGPATILLTWLIVIIIVSGTCTIFLFS